MSNETTVHVRRPGNPKKWRAKVLCEGKIADLALVTVEDDQFWTDELLDLQFVDVPELQASAAKHYLLFHTDCFYCCQSKVCLAQKPMLFTYCITLCWLAS